MVVVKWLRRLLLGILNVRVDDEHPGWMPLTDENEHTPAENEEGDWWNNLYARRAVAIYKSFVLAAGLKMDDHTSSQFYNRFWMHTLNEIPIVVEKMLRSLLETGNTYVLLWRNEQDGMSYTRMIEQAEVAAIVTAPNDRELEYSVITKDGINTVTYLTPENPESADKDVVILHFAINVRTAEIFGVSEFEGVAPWLRRYDAFLEDRARLHANMRAFLWSVTVPPGEIANKAAQYRHPPSPGTVIIKTESERWEAMAPTLHGADAEHDARAMYRTLTTGLGLPGHWLGDQETANLATATASSEPTLRRMDELQRELLGMVTRLCKAAYTRAASIGKEDISQIGEFTILVGEVSRQDNVPLTLAAWQAARAMRDIGAFEPDAAPALRKAAIEYVFVNGGRELTEEELKEYE